MLTENQYENKLIEIIKNNKGWKYLNSEEIYSKRGSFSEVLLIDEIEKALKRLNEDVTPQQINEAIFKLKDVRSSSLIEANQKFFKYLVEGVKVKHDTEDMDISLKIIDNLKSGLNDEWIITNQFKVDSRHNEYKTQRPDMVAYCNGLPLIVFELKTISEKDNLKYAYQQMKNYQEYIPDLFAYNAFNVVSNFSLVKYGTITSSLSRYQFWTGNPDFDQVDNDNLFASLLDVSILNDIIRNFTFYTSENTPSKIIASNHQYFGVKKAIDNSKTIISNNEKEGNGKAGIFWHTQGSGKSFSMLFLTKNLSRVIPGITFVVVTDRNDLDNQLYKTFTNARDYMTGQKIHQIESINNLKIELKDRKKDGVYFTTVQKFNSTVGLLSDRDNILVISDEAHRSHNNIGSTYEFDESEGEIVEKQGNAKYLRMAFPKATFIGFTGTPISTDDKSTTKIFGEIISKYLMTDAERDGIVVPIKYESRKPEPREVKEELEKLNSDYSEAINKIESETELSGEVQKKFNKALQRMENIISDPDRIELVSKDFIKHYEERKNILKGKAMFVAFNRKVALEYYRKIVELKPEWKENIKLIATSNKQYDTAEMQELTRDSEYRRRMAEEFKKENSDFKIAIVVDMWLTGFDVPCLDVIYLDKPIKMHNLMQAIARTNRVYNKGELNKEYGLVVDYVGLWSQLKTALAFYSGRDANTVESERDIRVLKETHLAEVDEIIKQFNLSSIFNDELIWSNKEKWVAALKKSTSIISELRLKEQFVKGTKDIHRWIKEVLVLLDEHELFKFQMLKLVRSNIINIELGKVDFVEMENDLISQINKAIKFDETTVVKEIEGNSILLSSILKIIDSEIEEELEYYDTDIKVAALRKLIDYTKSINYKQSQEFSDKLNEMLRRYNDGHLTIEELRDRIIEISKEARKMTTDELDERGFTHEELSFYKIVASPYKSDFDRNKIEQITRELLDLINESNDKIQYWEFNEHSKMELRMKMKELLYKHNYPPEEYDKTTDEIVEQIMYNNQIK